MGCILEVLEAFIWLFLELISWVLDTLPYWLLLAAILLVYFALSNLPYESIGIPGIIQYGGMYV